VEGIDGVTAVVKGESIPTCLTCVKKIVMDADDVYGPDLSVDIPDVQQVRTKYVFTPEMDEISGYGGAYEQTCRNMFAKGLEWLEGHPDADPIFTADEEKKGKIRAENVAAEEFLEWIDRASGKRASATMFEAVIKHCFTAKEVGWENYQKIVAKKAK
jgi:hypothetical protein